MPQTSSHPESSSTSRITHTIYHVYGRKVGCTCNLPLRRRQYKSKWGFNPVIRILEELTDATDKEASDKEWEWADKLGYKRGPHYTSWWYSSWHKNIPNRGFHTYASCPHCGLTTHIALLTRWHNDNCKSKKIPIKRPA